MSCRKRPRKNSIHRWADRPMSVKQFLLTDRATCPEDVYPGTHLQSISTCPSLSPEVFFYEGMKPVVFEDKESHLCPCTPLLPFLRLTIASLVVFSRASGIDQWKSPRSIDAVEWHLVFVRRQWHSKRIEPLVTLILLFSQDSKPRAAPARLFFSLQQG